MQGIYDIEGYLPMFTSGTLAASGEQSRIFVDPANPPLPPTRVTTVVTIPTWIDERMTTPKVTSAYYWFACGTNVNIWAEAMSGNSHMNKNTVRMIPGSEWDKSLEQK
jgi:hypothetical protein